MTVDRLDAELCAESVRIGLQARSILAVEMGLISLRRYLQSGEFSPERAAATVLRRVFSGIRREVDFAVFPSGALGESGAVEVFSKRFCRIAARCGPESAGVLRSGAATARAADPQRHGASGPWFAHRVKWRARSAFAHAMAAIGPVRRIRAAASRSQGTLCSSLGGPGTHAGSLRERAVRGSLAGKRNGWQANAQHATGRLSWRFACRRKIANVP